MLKNILCLDSLKVFCFLMTASVTTISTWATTVITSDTILQQNLNDNVVIGADDITLDCNGFSISGAPLPPGAGIALSSRNGVTIKNCTVNGFFNSLSVTGSSSVSLVDIIVQGAVLSGLEAFDNSHVSISGEFTARDIGVSAMFLINNVSVSMVGAAVTLERSTGGINLGVNSSLFVNANPPLPPTTIVAQDNTSFGLTAVSNSEYFLFGNVQVVSRRNGSNGFSIFSKSAVELDNGASLTVEDNALNGITLEDSTINMFNMSQSTGSTVTSRRNGQAGLNLDKASVFDMGDDATMLIEENAAGVNIDDGSSARVQLSTIINNHRNVMLSFGSRAEFDANTIGGRVLCDRSVLVRGDERCRRFGHDDLD